MDKQRITKRSAVNAFGSVRKLAEALGITTQAVYKWGALVPQTAVPELVRIKPEIGEKRK